VRTCGLVGSAFLVIGGQLFFYKHRFYYNFFRFYTFTSILCTISLVKLYYPFYLPSSV
jgi:hypothetical protein